MATCKSKTNVINYLKKEKLLDDAMNIKGSAFFTQNARLTQLAKDAYGVDMGPLFDTKPVTLPGIENAERTREVVKAIPNDAAFEAIDGSKYGGQNDTPPLHPDGLPPIVPRC